MYGSDISEEMKSLNPFILKKKRRENWHEALENTALISLGSGQCEEDRKIIRNKSLHCWHLKTFAEMKLISLI